MEKCYLVPEGKSRAEITQEDIMHSFIMVSPQENGIDVPTLKIPGDWKDEASHYWGVRKSKLDPENFFRVDNQISTSRSDNDWEDFTEITTEMTHLFVPLFEEIDPRWQVLATSLRIQKRYDSSKVNMFLFYTHHYPRNRFINNVIGLHPSGCNKSDNTSSLLSYEGRKS